MPTAVTDTKSIESIIHRGRTNLKLVIGNKNYSSWSMRVWVTMVAFEIPFTEIRIPLGQPNSAKEIAAICEAGRVPILIQDNMKIWDSLAICEYLAEQFHELHLWPRDMYARAMARSVCAEMHSSFLGMRSSMWMNIRQSFPGKGRTAASQADIGRISEIWEACLARFGPNEFLFGSFSIADAYFAPVVMRFRTYHVTLAPALEAYADRVIAHPAVARWIKEAEAEEEHIQKYDIYPD
jgi:glutathione S-transferase